MNKDMNIDEAFKLENHLCFSLYACSRAVSRMYRPILDELGITYTQYLVLLVLWEHNESTVKEISEMLDLDSGTLTPLLKRMESMNLVKRQRSSVDERVVIVRITEEGLLLREKAVCIPTKLLTASSLSVETIMDLNRQIKQLQIQINDVFNSGNHLE